MTEPFETERCGAVCVSRVPAKKRLRAHFSSTGGRDPAGRNEYTSSARRTDSCRAHEGGWTLSDRRKAPTDGCDRPRPPPVRLDEYLPFLLRAGDDRAGFLMAILHTRWYRSREVRYERLTRFFGTLLLINVAIGVVTGLVQEFQFGMNWSAYSVFVGDVFGAPLAMEGFAAFFLESTFLGFWVFGWKVLPRGVHLLRRGWSPRGRCCRRRSSWRRTRGCSTRSATRRRRDGSSGAG